MRRLESAESNAVEGNGTVAAKHVVETRGALFMKTTSQLASIVFAAVAISAASARADVLTLDNDLMQDTANTVIDNGAEPLDESMMNPLPLQTSNGGGIGIGLQVGSPTAITIKFSGAQQTGLVLGLGANFGYGNAFGTSLWLHADYLFTLAKLVDSQVDLTFYAGPGLFIAAFGGSNYGFGYRGNNYYNDLDVGFGLRLPIGLSLAFDSAPLEIYLEADPTLSLFPGIGFGIGGSLGFRFYF